MKSERVSVHQYFMILISFALLEGLVKQSSGNPRSCAISMLYQHKQNCISVPSINEWFYYLQVQVPRHPRLCIPRVSVKGKLPSQQPLCCPGKIRCQLYIISEIKTLYTYYGIFVRTPSICCVVLVVSDKTQHTIQQNVLIFGLHL